MKTSGVGDNLAEFNKLEPTPEQVDSVERILAVCRQVWNFALRERKDWLNSRKSPVNACSIL
ncbi:helix-turn-helix domain-containing protein [Nostoc sp. ChiQUE01b]|uniref:helix-turn-helix domain-containing protein n=1 Tax=Nostoc sp. ChiQUE01b TaxID=3075376 RepID=UPI002AD4D139|nr:helix-turn-helix domain-containing protein [Nostoc sp. ChiQUE01b]